VSRNHRELADELERQAEELEERIKALGEAGVEPGTLTTRTVEVLREAAAELRRPAVDLSKERWGVREDPED
jgi:hypothetical protein